MVGIDRKQNLYLFIWLIAGLRRSRNREPSRSFRSNGAGPMEFGELSCHVFSCCPFLSPGTYLSRFLAQLPIEGCRSHGIW